MINSYKFDKMNNMRDILIAIDLPPKLYNCQSILTILAIAQLEEKSKWNKVQEQYLRVHDMIEFINTYYPNKGETDSKRGNYSENSRETIRDDTVTPMCSLALLEHNGEKSQSEKGGYRLTKEFAILLKSFNSDEWNENLQYFISTHVSYKEKYDQLKHIDKGMPVKFNNETFSLSRSKHNQLQVDILNEFVPRFTPGSKLLYIGDTKKRELKRDDILLKKLHITVLDNAMLPDIILYNEELNWILFIEAYTSTGEFTIERVKKIQKYCDERPHDLEIIFVTAFATMKKCKDVFLSIAWDTEIWVAEEPTHMIHKNGDKFIGAHKLGN